MELLHQIKKVVLYQTYVQMEHNGAIQNKNAKEIQVFVFSLIIICIYAQIVVLQQILIIAKIVAKASNIMIINNRNACSIVIKEQLQKTKQVVNHLIYVLMVLKVQVKYEIDSLKIIRNTNQQLQNNQIEIDFNQDGSDQALKVENDSQNTLKQLENDQILQQYNPQQIYQENPFVQEQVNQQKDINQI
ncbi:transmembrane protein, putative (macronuclear) [Tetrahymena thermophila SB210]|uniref:Transmembrane protein, putative n=1 Tax=Tetrahymena thermophila (strain SB210) TaxID=312017 RepID=Q23PT0_TETTS|nr:transmembrane protein, putative [Tetrahymena thermophila SB210]EAR98605.2 transmembrane protein, putative [Tetrahymena thermophila SB210]|eukprot:XP_001018850.2 transmembrane protein, putative [Tetrahymena thermophila SB210]